jgi:hypothetical protein
MIDLQAYKKSLELETVEIHGVKLDVYFSYDTEGFTLEAVESGTDTQDLLPILGDKTIEKIEAAIAEKVGK